MNTSSTSPPALLSAHTSNRRRCSQNINFSIKKVCRVSCYWVIYDVRCKHKSLRVHKRHLQSVIHHDGDDEEKNLFHQKKIIIIHFFVALQEGKKINDVEGKS